MFKIKNLSKDDDHSLIVDLDKWGGQQEARGNKAGKEWYIENLLEELDSDREFFFDTDAKQLYYKPANDSKPPATCIVSKLKTIVNISGSKSNPVVGLEIRGVGE